MSHMNFHKKQFPFSLTELEWERRLTPDQFNILRRAATERAFSSMLVNENGKGNYVCAGCGHVVFLSDAKFYSDTGWPSFSKPADPACIETQVDTRLFYDRTEVHCANCGGHLGHVFDDKSQATGKRYAINGVSLSFKPEGT